MFLNTLTSSHTLFFFTDFWACLCAFHLLEFVVSSHKSSLLFRNWTLLEALNSSELKFVVLRCKNVKQKADMFFFKRLCSCTQHHKLLRNYILWVSAWNKQHFNMLGLLKQVVIPLMMQYFAWKDSIDIRWRVLWGLLGEFAFHSTQQESVSEQHYVGKSPGFLGQGAACFPEWVDRSNCCFD